MKDLVETYLYNRHPIAVTISYEGLPAPHVRITIQNQTPSYAVHVHEVRVHYGMKEQNRSFVLWPFDKVTIEPKDRHEWSLEYEPGRTKIQTYAEMPTPPPYSDGSDGPGIDSPASLFNAIGMGEAKDSWIEIDFNEYEKRIYKKGDVKAIFDGVGKATKALRTQKK